MKTEDLTKIGLTEDQAKDVIKLHKDTISGNYIPKATFDEERKKSKELQELLDNAKADAKDAEELKQQIANLKEESKKLQEEYEKKEIHRSHLDSVKKLLPDDVIDADDIISRLDIDSYTYKDDTVKGLSEDIEALRKSKPHYFKKIEDSKEENRNSNDFIQGIMGLQQPSESSKNGGNDDSEPESVKLGKQLGMLRMQSEKQAQEAREAFFN